MWLFLIQFTLIVFSTFFFIGPFFHFNTFFWVHVAYFLHVNKSIFLCISSLPLSASLRT